MKKFDLKIVEIGPLVDLDIMNLKGTLITNNKEFL